MNKTFLTISIVAAALLAGSQNLRADHLGKPHSEKSGFPATTHWLKASSSHLTHRSRQKSNFPR